MLWTRGVAARETLTYLDRTGIDAEPALFGAGISRRQLSQDHIGLSVASQYRFLELAAAEANDQLLGLHVAAELDLRSIGILFYLTGSAPTVSEALENLARYSRTTNEALVVEISRQNDEVILADINFLAGIIKRKCPTAPYLSDMRRGPPGASTERRRWKAWPMASLISSASSSCLASCSASTWRR